MARTYTLFQILAWSLLFAPVIPRSVSAQSFDPKDRSNTPLMRAVNDQDVAQVERLLAMGADAYCGNRAGLTPLKMAARLGSLELCRILLDDLAASDGAGRYEISRESALTAAAVQGHYRICKLLVEHKGAAGALESHNLEPLIAAINAEHIQIVELLLPTYRAVDLDSAAGPGLNAAVSGGNCTLIELLLNHMAGRRDEALAQAVRQKPVEVVQLLLNHGANPNTRVASPESPAFTVAKSIQTSAPQIASLLWQSEDVKKQFGSVAVLAARMAERAHSIAAILLHGKPPHGPVGNSGYLAGLMRRDITDVVRELSLTSADSPRVGDIETPLMVGVARGSPEIVRLLLARKADASARTTTESPLSIAVKANSMDIVDLLLANGASPDDVLWDGTPLMIAVQKKSAAMVSRLTPKSSDTTAALAQAVLDNQSEIASILLDNTAARNPTNNKGIAVSAALKGNMTLLQLLNDRRTEPQLIKAVNAKDGAQVQRLLDEGADVDTPDVEGQTPLTLAAMLRDEQTVGLLISRKANVNAPGILGKPALAWAIELNSPIIVRQLIANGADVNARFRIAASEVTVTALEFALNSGNLDLAKFIVNGKSDIQDKSTGLCLAAHAGYFDICQALLARGADANGKCRAHAAPFESPIENAAAGGSISICELLINHRADVKVNRSHALAAAWDERHKDIAVLLVNNGADGAATYTGSDFHRGSVFASAAAGGDLSFCRMLLAHGADVNADNGAALSFALTTGHHEVADYLLANGSDTNARNRAFLMQAALSHVDLAAWLLQKGANVDARDAGGTTALVRAVVDRNRDLINMLLKFHADANAKDSFGWTPLHAAQQNGDRDIVALLKKAGAR